MFWALFKPVVRNKSPLRRMNHLDGDPLTCYWPVRARNVARRDAFWSTSIQRRTELFAAHAWHRCSWEGRIESLWAMARLWPHGLIRAGHSGQIARIVTSHCSNIARKRRPRV